MTPDPNLDSPLCQTLSSNVNLEKQLELLPDPPIYEAGGEKASLAALQADLHALPLVPKEVSNADKSEEMA